MCHAIARAPYEPAGISVNGRSSALLSARRKLPGKLFSLNVSEQNAPHRWRQRPCQCLFWRQTGQAASGKGGFFSRCPGSSIWAFKKISGTIKHFGLVHAVFRAPRKLADRLALFWRARIFVLVHPFTHCLAWDVRTKNTADPEQK